ncbi:MAG: hypothetical protein IJU93_02845 [Lachnospiraceae bacterium]|nr:hypothetical protein [Lachnospiraceae bacterium]
MKFIYNLLVFYYKEDWISLYQLNKDNYVIDSTENSLVPLRLREMDDSCLYLSFDGNGWELSAEGSIKIEGYKNNRVDIEAEKAFVGNRKLAYKTDS